MDQIVVIAVSRGEMVDRDLTNRKAAYPTSQCAHAVSGRQLGDIRGDPPPDLRAVKVTAFNSLLRSRPDPLTFG
jgi:hypothetical protein